MPRVTRIASGSLLTVLLLTSATYPRARCATPSARTPPRSRGAFAPGRVWAGNGDGLRLIPRSDLDAEAQSVTARLLDGLRRDALSVAEAAQDRAPGWANSRVLPHQGPAREGVPARRRGARGPHPGGHGSRRAALPRNAESNTTLTEALAPPLAPVHPVALDAAAGPSGTGTSSARTTPRSPVALDAAAGPSGADPAADPPAARGGSGGR